MYPVTFKKNRAEYFLRCLKEGKRISHDPKESEWTRSEMLQLAGACFCWLLGGWLPPDEEDAGLLGRQPLERESLERLEAQDATCVLDLYAAIGFVGELNALIWDEEGEYDERCEDLIQCLVGQSCEVEIDKTMKPLRGFKKKPKPPGKELWLR